MNQKNNWALKTQQSGSAERINKLTPGVVNNQAQPSNRIEPIIDKLNHQHLQTLQEALEEKDKQIKDLKKKLECNHCDLEVKEVTCKECYNCAECFEHIIPKKKTKASKLTKIRGLLTTNLRTRKSTSVPYMAFFRPDSANKHRKEDCEATKCQACEIPVVFRIKDIGRIYQDEDTSLEIRPILKKGNTVILEGEFSPSKDSNRPSFTCYSYQIINDHE